MLALPGAVPTVSAGPEHLRRVLSEWVVDVASSGSMVVVKTPPGCAHVVASALDRGALHATLGTVAGDDTILVVVDDRVGGASVARELRAVAGLRPLARPSARPRRATAAPDRKGS
jgi:transcriptional regulator of arginine metabolism